MARHMYVAPGDGSRLRIVGVCWLALTAIFLVRLFYIQTAQRDTYQRQADGARNLNQIIKASRGEVFVRDARDGQETLYPAALNRDRFLLISDNRKVEAPETIAALIASAAALPAEEEIALREKFIDKRRAYQVLLKDVKPEVMELIQTALAEREIKGLYFDREPARFYPERDLMAHVTGFVGRDDKGQPIGRYGIEGFYEERLRGVNGFVKTEKDPFGGWIPVADRDFTDARDGDDIILTIDRAIQLKLCEALHAGVAKHQARRGSGIIMEPTTGAILAMCNVPTFDPNEYQKVEEASVYNNDAIFRTYEPGSVFKAFTMAAALDSGAVRSETTYEDTGSVQRDGFTIRNAANKIWGRQNMAFVIKESLNTGTVFAAEAVGGDRFRGYMEQFGFGVKTGIDLKTEEKGNIKSLSKKGKVYLATASFGQGLTTTPMQLVAAYGALANKGVLMKPYVVHAWRSPDGAVEMIKPTEVRHVVSERAAREITAMMRAVVEDGHGKAAQVNGYSIVGKTGTAQIVGAHGKYEDESINNHTFIGYGPEKQPRFVMLITYEAPQARFAETTAVPTFGEVAKFLLEYLGAPHDK